MIGGSENHILCKNTEERWRGENFTWKSKNNNNCDFQIFRRSSIGTASGLRVCGLKEGKRGTRRVGQMEIKS